MKRELSVLQDGKKVWLLVDEDKMLVSKIFVGPASPSGDAALHATNIKDGLDKIKFTDRISKEELRKGLQEISKFDRLFQEDLPPLRHHGRFVLCKEVWGDGRGEGNNNTEMECESEGIYFEEGVDELYKALTGGI